MGGFEVDRMWLFAVFVVDGILVDLLQVSTGA